MRTPFAGRVLTVLLMGCCLSVAGYLLYQIVFTNSEDKGSLCVFALGNAAIFFMGWYGLLTSSRRYRKKKRDKYNSTRHYKSL